LRGLICDDHPLMRQALVASFRARWPGVTFDEADSYPSAWVKARSGPEFCLVDLAMPGAGPVEGVARLKAAAPDAVLLVLTGLQDKALIRDVEACGVAAVLPKTLESEALLEVVEQLLPLLGDAAGVRLAPRQLEVLKLLSDGLTNKQIALQLQLSPATVKIHVARVIELLAASNRTDAVSRAQRAGLV
jgi:DNA-binding NarL/FixJ family response regulator